MTIGEFFRLAGLLMRLSSPKPPGKGRARRDLASPQGMRYDRFEPDGSPRAVLAAIHGATLNGKDDPRLQHLARCLAASGALCLVPTIPGLSRFEWTPSDIDRLAAFIRWVSDDGTRPGLIGFSHGGGYALLAAAHPLSATRVGFVLSFGAYHDLGDLFRRQADFGRTWPENPKDWDNWLYLRLVMAKRHGDRLSLSDAVLHRLTDLLERYCHAGALEEKRAFHDRYLSGEDLVGLERAAMDDLPLERLSPAGKLGAIQCPVGLLHDAADSLIPPEHARRLARELAAAGKRHRLLITELLHHVDLSHAMNFSEWRQLATMLSPLVQRPPRGT